MKNEPKPGWDYDCTLAKMAENIGIELWQAMEMMKYGKQRAETAIREAIAGEIPKKFNSQNRSNEGFNRDYITGYNDALSDAQRVILKGGGQR